MSQRYFPIKRNILKKQQRAFPSVKLQSEVAENKNE
jgi:hypothetical protein